MKSILLSSAAIVAFAGAAAADGHASIGMSGEATLGYNSDDGFDAGLDITVTGSATLDNGLTAGFSLGGAVNVEDAIDDGGWSPIRFDDYELSLTSDSAGLYFGNTDTAAGINFDAGSALDNAPEADFDGDITGDNTDDLDAVLRGEVTMGGVSAAISYGIDIGGDLSHMQLSASTTVGAANISLAYQDADHDGLNGDGNADNIDGEAIALGVTTTAGGADLSFGYLSTDADETIGLGVSYPVGPVTLSANYAMNDVADDAWAIAAAYEENGISAGLEYNSDDFWKITGGYAAGAVAVDVAFDSDDKFSLEGSYDVGNGLTVFAGLLENGGADMDYYVGGEMDLGGGASLLVSVAEDDDDSEGDEIGANDYSSGTTVELTFAF